MKKLLLAAAAVAALGSVPTIASAELAFNVGAATEYRYRGIAQSRFKPAFQGGADFSAGGFYVGTWASTIKWIKDAGGDANYELDLYGGYKGEIGGVSYDVGMLRYLYPGAKLAVSPNTTEIYGAVSAGGFTVKYSHATTNLFGFANSDKSGYLDVSASFEIADGWSVAPHIGYQKVKGAGNDIYSYTDYALTLSKDFSGLVVSAALIGASVDKIGGVPTYVSPSGKNLGRNSLVVGLKYNF
jgi:uncharacterized protein (TIGR02001 family)